VAPTQKTYQNGEIMIKVTEAARQQICALAEEQGIDKLFLRLKVVGGGCAGFQYDLYFDEIIGELDEVSEDCGVKIIVDPLSNQYLDGSEIDLVETPMSSSLKIINPNVTSTCGCGNSFLV
jgi:iron-sulfur cluster insertion protein